MSFYFSTGFLKPQYFNAKYLSGGNEGQSGWRRLIISQLQEAELNKEKESEENSIPVLTSTIVPETKEVRKGVIRNRHSIISPEEEIAKDVLKTLPKPIYRNQPEITDFGDGFAVLLRSATIHLSELWQRLGVSAGIVENPIGVVEVEDTEDDDIAMLLLMA